MAEIGIWSMTEFVTCTTTVVQMWYIVRWPFFELMDEALGNNATRHAATSCSNSTARQELASSTCEAERTAVAVPPVDEPPETAVACEPQLMTRKRRAGGPPRWFKVFIEEERQMQNEWKEELRGYFERFEQLQTKRLELLKKAVGQLSEK